MARMQTDNTTTRANNIGRRRDAARCGSEAARPCAFYGSSHLLDARPAGRLWYELQSEASLFPCFIISFHPFSFRIPPLFPCAPLPNPFPVAHSLPSSFLLSPSSAIGSEPVAVSKMVGWIGVANRETASPLKMWRKKPSVPSSNDLVIVQCNHRFGPNCILQSVWSNRIVDTPPALIGSQRKKLKEEIFWRAAGSEASTATSIP